MSPREMIVKAFDWKVVRDLGVPVVFCVLLLYTTTKQSDKLLDAQLSATAANTQLLREMVNVANEIRACEQRQDTSLAAVMAAMNRLSGGEKPPAGKAGG